MSAITIPLEFELTPRSREVMDALSRIMNPQFVAADDAQAHPAPTTTALHVERLVIGQPYPGVDGIYAGLTVGLDGEPDGHLVLLNALPEGELEWAAANAWAEGLGDGARLPTRFESALLYANLQAQFPEGGWFWTGTQFSESLAWHQNFSDGYQGDYHKSFEARCRAVRRFTA